MQLGAMSNLILTTLQQPGASFTVGGGGSPNWASVTNAQFGQGLVEFCINEGYTQLMGDLEELELALVTFPITSTLTTYKYTIPPSATYAEISSVARVFYQPKGLTYSREFRPGTELVSWAQFQRYTAQGYLAPYAFGTIPRWATVDPLLTSLYFYPGSANAGDTITVDYSPLPTLNSTNCPTLVASTDTPLLPTDCHMAVVQYALSLLWVRARELATAGVYKKLYDESVVGILKKYVKKHHGDTFRLEAFADRLSIGGL